MSDKWSSLVPELSDWNNGAGISVESWIGCIGQFDHAIGYGTIFWPEFVVHDDCVLRYEIDDDRYQNCLRTCSNDKTAIEALFNHLHVANLFPNSKFQPTQAVVVHLGSMLKEMWSYKLRAEFPNRQFDVVFDHEDAVELLVVHDEPAGVPEDGFKSRVLV